MKVLAYSRIGLALDKGTPLRFRHLVQELERFNDIELELVSRDKPESAARALPGVAHYPTLLGREQDVLYARVKDFNPDVVYGLTDKAAYDMVSVGINQGRIRLVVDLHGHLPAERLEESSRSFFDRWFSALRATVNQRRHFPKMDGFTTVGQILAEKFAIFGKPTQVLWGGVNPALFRVTTPPQSPNIRVAYAGNFRPYQGVTTLIEAGSILVKNNEPFHFTLVGDIDKFSDVKELAQRGLGDHVHMTGRVPYEQVPEILSRADVLVVPRAPGNAAQFNYPSKLSEYMSLGKPVVVHSVGEVIHVINDRENGLLVPPESPSALAGALLQLKDPTLRDKLGSQARQFVEQELSWEKIGGKLYQFLDSLAA